MNLNNPELDCSKLPPYGLPLPLLPQHMVSLTGDRHLKVHSYLFEFSESLSVLGTLAQALQWTLTEAVSTPVSDVLSSVEHLPPSPPSLLPPSVD